MFIKSNSPVFQTYVSGRWAALPKPGNACDYKCWKLPPAVIGHPPNTA